MLCGNRVCGRRLFDAIKEERHLAVVEVVATGEVGGGIAVLEHMMEGSNQMTATTAALLGTCCQAVEGIGVADIPIGRRIRAVGEELNTGGATLVICIYGGIERGVVVTDVVVGCLADLVLHIPGGEGDETEAERAVELIGSTDKPLVSCLDKVFERCTRGEVALGYVDYVAHVGLDETGTGTLAALLHALPQLVLLISGEGVSLADVAKDAVDTVNVVVDDGDVLTVLIHNWILIMSWT